MTLNSWYSLLHLPPEFWDHTWFKWCDGSNPWLLACYQGLYLFKLYPIHHSSFVPKWMSWSDNITIKSYRPRKCLASKDLLEQPKSEMPGSAQEKLLEKLQNCQWLLIQQWRAAKASGSHWLQLLSVCLEVLPRAARQTVNAHQLLRASGQGYNTTFSFSWSLN